MTDFGVFRIIIALRYLASDPHQTFLTDNIGVHQNTVSNTIEDFVTALNYPTTVSPTNCCCSSRWRLGTHIRLLQRERVLLQGRVSVFFSFCFTRYRDRAAHRRFMYINGDFPGSVYDSTVYTFSRIHDAFKEGRVSNGCCLNGDSRF